MLRTDDVFGQVRLHLSHEAVEPLSGKRLRVTFINGTIKIYDCKPLLKEEAFQLLGNEAFFRAVSVELHGYAVVWNDQVDLAESELWLHGQTSNHRLQRTAGASAKA